MKIKSQKIIDKNGVVREYSINHFNSDGLVERKEYLNADGKVTFYAIFSYDDKGNWITKNEFDSEGNIQVSYQREFDAHNREIKSIELTAENIIREWNEKQYPDNKTIIYISKDEHGKIDHKTIENTESKERQMFRAKDILYATIKEKFDNKNRLINRRTIDSKGNITEENQYVYIESKHIWKLFINGKYIKSEERIIDRNGSVKYYEKKDENGKVLEWSKSEMDDFGNVIAIEGAVKSDEPTYRNLIEYEYLEK